MSIRFSRLIQYTLILCFIFLFLSGCSLEYRDREKRSADSVRVEKARQDSVQSSDTTHIRGSPPSDLKPVFHTPRRSAFWGIFLIIRGDFFRDIK